ESKPGSKDPSPYGMVRSWIDPRKMVAMRVEKFNKSGRLARRIDTTRVYKDDRKQYIPASLDVRRSGGASVTEIEGSNIRHDVTYTDWDFTAKALNDYRVPR
ncbi:MAG: outer membrane lipoprotein-sorting protein, partial [Verrucomicrobiales bacterium]